MTDYNEILEAETDPEAPSTSSLWKRWSKNWIAGFEGNAPQKLANAAIADGTIGAAKFQSGTIEAAWVGQMMVNLGVGALGTYGYLIQATATTAAITAGSNYAGSGLRWAGDHEGVNLGLGGAPSGTWRAHGTNNFGNSGRRSTLFLRVL